MLVLNEAKGLRSFVHPARHLAFNSDHVLLSFANVNHLYYGDNLDVLRRYLKDDSVDLVYLDPPFKSNQDYNVLFAEKDGTGAAAQFKAFEDTWEWNQESALVFQELVEAGGRGLYDLITLVDVLEHVSDPLALLREVQKLMAADGYLLLVTSDVNSLAARIFGWKWWHFRVAHVAYFNRKTLGMGLAQANLQAVVIFRPGWYFSLEYLGERLKRYVPIRARLQFPRGISRMVIPVNLRDSLGVVATLARTD